MSGRELAARARRLNPDIKVLLTSGYAEELVHGDDLKREKLKVLRSCVSPTVRLTLRPPFGKFWPRTRTKSHHLTKSV
jgi:hypothetical protein